MSAYQLLWTPSHLQQVFGCLQAAFSRPGTLTRLEHPVGELAIHYSILACLVDHQVSMHDAGDHLPRAFKHLLACQEAGSKSADFLFYSGDQTPGSAQHKVGRLSHPEMSSTLIVLVDDFNSVNANVRLTLSGPGIQASTQLTVAGLNVEWLQLRNQQCAAFPLGNDYIVCSEHALMALPRSTKLEFEVQ